MRRPSADRLLRDLAGEIEAVMKADRADEVTSSQLPLLDICVEAHSPGSETGLDELIDASIKRLADEQERGALLRLFGGEDRWRPLAVRGPAAARELGISYDALRRRGKDGRRRLDTLLGSLAESIADLVSLQDLLGEANAVTTNPDPGDNAFDRASVFLSYARSDDEHEGGLVSNLREALVAEFKFQTGQDLFVFQDKSAISLGENWRRKLEDNLDTTNFLLVVLTPSYLRSRACRDELQRFLSREGELGRDDLVLPLYYATLAPSVIDGDPLARALLEHQYVDWRNLRFQEFSSAQVRMAIAELASAISAAMARSQRGRSQRGPENMVPAKDEPGLVERLAEMEFALPRFLRTLHAMIAEQEGVTEEVHEAHSEVDRLNSMGRGGAARLVVARRLATKLEPYAERMEECAADIRSDLDSIEDGINAFAEALPGSDEDGVDEAAEMFLSGVHGAYEASLPAREALREMSVSFEMVGRAASTLRPVLTRIVAAVQVLVLSTDRFEAWIRVLEGARAERQQRLAALQAVGNDD